MITMHQLKQVMIFQLTNFNDEGVSITEETIHKDVLSDDDGLGHINSRQLYYDVIRFTLKRKGHELKEWPGFWIELTVADLAVRIL
jgi:hypothetical protein